MGIPFLKMAVVYFLVGIGYGIYMDMTQDFDLKGAHAHINLAGWVSMALFGIIYHYFQSIDNSLAKVHFWLYNIAMPIFMISLSFVLTGNISFVPGIIVGSNLLAIAVLVFASNVLFKLKASNEAKLKQEQNMQD
ncbi:cytochrome-c oxidase [Pontibacillus yanchengensis]|uniref:Cytochrome-c oxidase n=2 Tax=Pontibacillus yanchengensis TaxID=462910 RepID=A0A6I4ZVX1_9BACI|nr:cbb3-type cytochrome c oxidase subunit I [Pontibacillus yanchengensis]MYL32002.1 cytochrome-c oxidase [Pontibacillus yanchengensis]MYL52579.1 cytochrome-c oxidase [Pontibacillus yanchengensis]